MAENDTSLAEHEGEEGMLLSPTDSKHWEVVQLVNAQFGPTCATTEAACKAAGVHTSLYYRAMKSPVVQQMRVQQILGVQAATQRLVERNWLKVLESMIRIAREGDSREAVQAARFLRDVYGDVKEGLEPGRGGRGAESEAAKAIRSFLGGKPVKLRQTVTTQEIELQSGRSSAEISDGNIVEGEVVSTG